MPRPSADERVWLTVDVSTEVAERFRARARAEDRSGAAQLRHIIREHVSLNDENQPGMAGSREISGIGAAGHGTQ